jgi:beta-lactamase regulating signal transducer with metallopeptidase domain
MTQWLIDTFVWTGCLIAAVLLLRGPVARHFGAQVAYALWALPFVRLLLPPLVLPASFAPAANLPLTTGAMAAEPLLVLPMDTPPLAAGFDWTPGLLALWLGGAIAFLAWRLHQYRAMRADLLADARPVGEVGRVRLVETPAVSAPVAFGVHDKVVALPPLFMAQDDRAARDLAIAHELAHHRGHDLLANIAAQPLLALHWFNPLAWWGWRAMRRDQEAACDARVVAGREQAEKATYARVIAGFATGRHLPLANPLACPMAGSLLGEKSIIHRLRSLTLNDVSSSRRKLGLAAIAGTALVTLPLTASVTYAQPEAPEAPEAPQRIIRVERQPGGHEAPNERRVIIRRHGEQQTVETGAMADAEMAEVMAELRDMDAEIDAEVAEAMAEARAEMAENSDRMPRIETRCDGDQTVQQRTDNQGRQVVVICRRAVQASAAMGLREAQRTIRETPGMSADQRERIVNELQDQIDRMERGEVSYRVTPPTAPMAPAGVAKPRVPAVPVTPVAYMESGRRMGVTSTKASTASQRTATQPVKLVPVPESGPVRVLVDATILFNAPPIAS